MLSSGYAMSNDSLFETDYFKIYCKKPVIHNPFKVRKHRTVLFFLAPTKIKWFNNCTNHHGWTLMNLMLLYCNTLY